MNKRLLAILVVGLVSATTACAISPAQRAKYERSGCTQVAVLQGCDLDKSSDWNQRHGYIKDAEARQNHSNHHGKHRNRENSEATRDDRHEDAGINGKFAGNYVAKFESGERGADIHIEDSGVYINGKEVRDVNTYKNTLTFRDGFATYTIKDNHWGSWKDEDSGNHGSIQMTR